MAKVFFACYLFLLLQLSILLQQPLANYIINIHGNYVANFQNFNEAQSNATEKQYVYQDVVGKVGAI